MGVNLTYGLLTNPKIFYLVLNDCLLLNTYNLCLEVKYRMSSTVLISSQKQGKEGEIEINKRETGRER
jgi:hypothetical protein